MKECPVCKSVVDEEFECPICRTALTDEPQCYSQGERYAFNKFFLRYVLRQCWFSVISLIVVLVMTFFTAPGVHQLCILAWVLAILSGLMGAFQRKCIKIAQFKYSEEYARFGVTVGKYIAAGGAIFVAIMMVALSFDMY